MTPEQRRRCMQSVHSKDTGPEMLVRRWLWKQGFRYRLHVKRLPGTPDIVLHRYHTVINVNGCFWHGHDDCRLFVVPKSNTPFWEQKFARNRARDAENREKLRHMGWYSITIWECQLQPATRQATLIELSQRLSEIFLKINGAKRIEEAEPLLAAEPRMPYGAKQD